MSHTFEGADPMHRFLTAFLVLSTLAMTQNVVAGTPSPSPAREGVVSELRSDVTALAADEAIVGPAVGGQVPSPGTMLLLVTGLAGLSAVGSPGRSERREGVRA